MVKASLSWYANMYSTDTFSRRLLANSYMLLFLPVSTICAMGDGCCISHQELNSILATEMGQKGHCANSKPGLQDPLHAFSLTPHHCLLESCWYHMNKIGMPTG